ncbi:hypothetical protein A3D60_01635 [Candidatus Uhrbacteria bacterium RIFCSPHIGHO2_02_FULL_47_29]|uniref:DDH domain-containing protein n=1 Tax=Candidatus Uhrbacteria bacterium RIFCSPLOWO2_01_FULL_47_25 TaxID=1802402 RepID=A0A1F7UWI5_9BACT|nr:MAG: Phosphoesterase RecJ domain protein [Parcubacteria group bacterium GW2011_GWA2_46_9]OGL60013.1 MAG: hypothetical protein A2752_03665 [Candidatus Uhrbacteria bacterium RIFCSPHIGHO2_01_FULL_46_23]OGL69511.1 MAG: hypothetical protein A3D60_01635 [Candidatus Uhrbacteria bacterium RIFCSPHIGHO2_02_FULL_47_29]OGL82639.1 MAG: hypothetical protein A2936_04885 [Candidatus Uhrbacteria bacterium RIFCSPLOWO2_01_FULL_47_25]OGL86683.1 MAG: hypothetical protein A3I37_05180 [Candidatus Uhrbacteria bacte
MTVFSHYRKALEALLGAKNPIFILLQSVDADALGSTMALVHALEKAGVQPTIFCASAIPTFLQFLVKGRVIENDGNKLNLEHYDLAIVTDAGSIHRTGIQSKLEAYVQNGGRLLNIDHHHVHEPFGTVNLIDEMASATAVLVYDILKLGGWAIDADIATSILVGIVADTDNFSNAGTTMRALTIAAECYAKGAEVRQVWRGLYRHQPLQALQLWGLILSRLERNDRWGIVATIILQEDFKRHGLSDEAIDGLANFLSSLSDTKATMVLTEILDNQIKGSLRTTRDDIDVSKLATALGGGGHKKAAGFTVPGRLVRTEQGWRIV